ncbi:MAG: MFS transporter [Patescibacteria group bacterium]|nr:MFS transporter [Patescibacteria group bacterium]
MSIFPKIERITRDATISHFFLMFGYKLFSLYFPLFLVAKGMSLPEVGYTYLLIYLTLALFAPIVGFFSHKINPAILATIGILGYGIYALGMILISPQTIFGVGLFYFWQVLLGISAALFFASARAILISSPIESYDRAFGWFYSAPFYAEAIAPAVGALFVWKFNFIGVFIFSLIIQFFNAIFCFTQFSKQRIPLPNKLFNFQKFIENYKVVLQKLKIRDILLPIFISFSVLLLFGFYRAFFVLFLKDQLNWSQNLILIFISISSLLFSPLSLFLIKRLELFRSEKNIFQGGLIVGTFSILFGILMPVLNFLSVLIIKAGQFAGSLVTNAGRSGLLSQRLKENPEEAGAIDTIFSPLGVALGALISGIIIDFLGYQLLFILGGLFVIGVGLLSRFTLLEILSRENK